MSISVSNYKSLYNSKEATIQLAITNPQGDGNDYMFVALFTSELTISGGAHYESLFDTGMQEEMSKKVGLIREMLGGGGGSVRLVTFAQTAKSYINSEHTQFQIDFVKVAINANDNPLGEVKQLLRLVYPRFQSGDMGFKGFMESPTDYRYESSGKTQGTASIRYSTWFWGKDLIITNVSFTPSKAVTRTGTPLYVTGTIQFEPYRSLEQGELLQFFTK